MYQYKAFLITNKETPIAEDHSIQGIENKIKHFKRQQNKGEHTQKNVPIEIFHFYTDTGKKKLIKIV